MNHAKRAGGAVASSDPKSRAQQKIRTRQRIVDAAAGLLRERGFGGVGVAEIMDRAGLTHGGFYAHFSSKTELLGVALASAAQSSLARTLDHLGDLRGLTWVQEAVRSYLSRGHRDDVAGGCAYAALGNDTARADETIKKVMEEQVCFTANALAKQLENGGLPGAEDRSLALLSLCVGGLSLARAVHDRALSDRILLATQRFAFDSLQSPGD